MVNECVGPFQEGCGISLVTLLRGGGSFFPTGSRLPKLSPGPWLEEASGHGLVMTGCNYGYTMEKVLERELPDTLVCYPSFSNSLCYLSLWAVKTVCGKALGSTASS